MILTGMAVNNKNGKKRRELFSSIKTKMLVYVSLLFIITFTLIELSKIYGIPFTEFKGDYFFEQTEVFKNLDLVADLKKGRLERLLTEIKNDIRMFSDNPFIISMMVELKKRIQGSIDNEMSGETLWAEVRKWDTFKELNEYLGRISKQYDTYDEAEIFDLKTGTILACPGDWKIGTDIYEDTYKFVIFNSSVVKNSFKYGDLHFHIGIHQEEDYIDFDIYAPISYGNKTLAVLKLDINVSDIILPLLHTGKGLGDTGEALLVDHERRILTRLKHALPDGTVPEAFNYKIEAKPALFAALGDEGMIMAEDYRGVDVLAAFRHIRVTPDTGWGLVVKKDRAEVFAHLDDILKYSILIGAIGFFFFGVFIFIITNNITNPIIKLSSAVKMIGEGDLGTKIEVLSNDEVGRLATDFDEMRLKLKESYRDLEGRVMEKTTALFNTVEKLKELNEDMNKTQNAILNLVEDLEDSKATLEIEIEEHENAEVELAKHRDNLEVMVQERTIELEMSNTYLEEAVKELETFSYSISHDLKAPLRAISGYSGMLHQDYSGSLDEEGNRLLGVINDNAMHMGKLIEDILQYSKMVRKPLKKGELHIKKLTEGVILELEGEYKDRDIEFNVQEMPNCKGDSVMIKQVLMNLVSNAIKYTGNKEKAKIEVGSKQIDNETVYYVKDNGVGFNMKYADKLFGLFQRLHSTKEFEGTGVGLAIVQTLVNKHRGKIWADAKVNVGAIFYFSL